MYDVSCYNYVYTIKMTESANNTSREVCRDNSTNVKETCGSI